MVKFFPQVSAAEGSVAAVAADKLWQLQLRKENKAILEKLQENEKLIQSGGAEANRKTEAGEAKIVTLEARLAEDERKREALEKMLDQAQKEHRREIAALKLAMKDMIEGRISNEERQPMIEESPTSSLTSISSSTFGQLNEHIVQATHQQQSRQEQALRANSHAGTSDESRARHANHILPTSNEMIASAQTKATRRCPLPVYVNAEDEGRHTNDNEQAPHLNTTRQAKKSVATRRPATRSTQAREVPADPVHTPPEPATKIPKLSQGPGSIKAYYANACAIYEALTMSGPQMEFDFIYAWIKGLTDKKSRERLVDELQQIHPSKNKKDGSVQILCEWDDMSEGLRKAGLLNAEKEPTKRRNRMLAELDSGVY